MEWIARVSRCFRRKRRIQAIPFNRIFDLGFKPLPWGGKGYLPSRLTQVGDISPTSSP